MTISLIAAMTKKRVIGKKNDLPWHLPDDFKHFKRTTLYKPVIMGHTTFKTLGKPLEGRQNIVISRDEALTIPGCTVAHSLQEALLLTSDAPESMIIGGAQIYAQALPIADKLYLTIIDTKMQGDTFFPDFDMKDWEEIACVKHPKDDQHKYAFQFLTLVRKNTS